MNIALCHFRVGETDGVSLEMDKWKIELEKMGHSVYLLAGSSGSGNGYVIPELHYKSEVNYKIVKNAYGVLEDYKDEEEFQTEIESYATRIQIAVEKFLMNYKIDLLIPNNIWSLGWGLPAGIGIYNAVKNTNVKCIAHNHDFYWERIKYAHPTCGYVNELLLNYFPPKNKLITYQIIIKNQAKLKIQNGKYRIIDKEHRKGIIEKEHRRFTFLQQLGEVFK